MSRRATAGKRNRLGVDGVRPRFSRRCCRCEHQTQHGDLAKCLKTDGCDGASSLFSTIDFLRRPRQEAFALPQGENKSFTKTSLGCERGEVLGAESSKQGTVAVSCQVPLLVVITVVVVHQLAFWRILNVFSWILEKTFLSHRLTLQIIDH